MQTHRAYQITLLEYRFESLNTMLRQHWSQRKRKREELWEQVQLAAPQPTPEFTGRVRLIITRQWGKRQRALDPDNLVASCKMLIDCLKKPKGRSRYGLGIIPDDSPGDIELVVRQEKAADGVAKAIITLEQENEA